MTDSNHGSLIMASGFFYVFSLFAFLTYINLSSRLTTTDLVNALPAALIFATFFLAATFLLGLHLMMRWKKDIHGSKY